MKALPRCRLAHLEVVKKGRWRLETIRHLIGCPNPAGHALFKRLTLKFRLLPHHTAQQSDNGKSDPLKHHTLTTILNYSTGVHYVVTGALKNSIVHAC